MTHPYKWIQWNRHKRLYDLTLTASCTLYLAVFIAVTAATNPPPNDISAPIILMRAVGSLAILLLHVVLIIGPLARFTTLAAPLLYNRRHLGVVTFCVALAHAVIALLFYGGFGVQDPLNALIFDRPADLAITAAPFEAMGLAALIILFLLAATSHDFWLSTLSPRVWKSLHMSVYLAYALVLLHVAFGALQSEPATISRVLLMLGFVVVAATHIAAAIRQRRIDRTAQVQADGEWLDAGPAADIREGHATLVASANGTNAIAVFRTANTLVAVAAACPHQGGPIAEGRIINGCITCPWHGHQFDPCTGKSPPPYTDAIPTYRVRIDRQRVLVRASPQPIHEPATPASLPADAAP